MKPKPLPLAATTTTYRRRSKPNPMRKATKPPSPSPLPKRQARGNLPLPHTGPLTRASHHLPLNPGPTPEDAPQLDGEEREAPPRAQIEAAKLSLVSEEVEAALLRGAGVHVVPSFGGKPPDSISKMASSMRASSSVALEQESACGGAALGTWRRRKGDRGE
uniref:Uncharacterized protein n=1 Tax=Oryza meridionalis TaxID=40149 RepID=A0A0E0CXP0_9ORYZ